MATRSVDLVNTEYRLVSSLANFLVTPEAGYGAIECIFAAALPVPGDAGHVLNVEEGLVRNGLSGTLYAKAQQPTMTIVVTDNA